jgi:hypothetical protein
MIGSLLQESGDYVLQEDGSKIYVQPLAYTFATDAGAYSITGQSAALLVDTLFKVDAGTFTITGQNAAFSPGFDFDLFPGVYSITGFAASLSKEQPIVAADLPLIRLRSFTESRRI